ncbi:MAG TPA: hypothetical protein EYP59_21125 [Thiotrichaceae bacterium]|nr:hypothetical protein [Thiotrichaceae bacterium]
MNKQKELQLLTKIAKLLEKYGPDSCKALAILLSNEELTQTIIVTLLQNIVLKAKSVSHNNVEQKPQVSKNANTFRSSLVAIQERDFEQGTLLLHLFDGLQNKQFLPTLREMKTFAEDNSLVPITAKSRKSAINQFVKAFLTMPIHEIKSILKLLEEKTSIENSSLEAWSSIILNKTADIK